MRIQALAQPEQSKHTVMMSCEVADDEIHTVPSRSHFGLKLVVTE
jgi:hypothetical protein